MDNGWESFWENPDARQTGASGLDQVTFGNRVIRPGDRVRLGPKHGADAFDLILAGRIARIESIERDYEDRLYLAVTIEDDPGQDLGALRQPGHRFFYTLEEITPLEDSALPGESTI